MEPPCHQTPLKVLPPAHELEPLLTESLIRPRNDTSLLTAPCSKSTLSYIANVQSCAVCIHNGPNTAAARRPTCPSFTLLPSKCCGVCIPCFEHKCRLAWLPPLKTTP